MQRTVLLSQFCLSVSLSVRPSVCLSVRRVYCDKTKWCTADSFIPHETVITVHVVFLAPTLVGGRCPFPVKYSPKVIHPRAKLIVPCNQYFICIRQMALRSRYPSLTNSTASRPAHNHWQCWQLHDGLFGHRQSHGLSAIPELLVTFYLFSIITKHQLHILAASDQQLPVDAGGWSVAVNIDYFHLGDMQQTQHAQEKQEVHLTASDPDHMPHVGRQVVERRQHCDDVRTTVELLPQQPASVRV